MFKYITDKPLWVNILAGLGLTAILIMLFFLSLNSITGYGKYEKVPDVEGQQFIAAEKMLEEMGFHVAIQDSVYIDSLPPLTVIKQSPEKEETVKTGRTIYLTINRAVPPLVEMPNLIGFSIRSAEIYLQSLGLKLGYITYKPDIAQNAVLEQLFQDNKIAPGAKIPLGSAISFVLGSGVSGASIPVPDLVGLTVQEALHYLATIQVQAGSIVATSPVSDTAMSYVIRQTPAPFISENGVTKTNQIKPGQMIDLFISPNKPIVDSTSNQELFQ